MIFVTVGTHEQQFNRLVKGMDELILDNVIMEKVFIQKVILIMILNFVKARG